jgi:hypothetical protein
LLFACVVSFSELLLFNFLEANDLVNYLLFFNAFISLIMVLYAFREAHVHGKPTNDGHGDHIES